MALTGAAFSYHKEQCNTCTVTTINTCPKCAGRPGILHDRTPDCHSDSWGEKTLHAHYVTAKYCIHKQHSSHEYACPIISLGMPGQLLYLPVAGGRPVDWYRN